MVWDICRQRNKMTGIKTKNTTAYFLRGSHHIVFLTTPLLLIVGVGFPYLPVFPLAALVSGDILFLYRKYILSFEDKILTCSLGSNTSINYREYRNWSDYI
jgi:hypothetical protein